MTKQKAKMSFIENETARKSTFKKRKSGLLKKSHELATLCGVPICVFINSAYDLNTEVWPTREGANRIVSQWNTLPPMDKTKKMVNQETFLRQRISKATESLRKLRRENKELEMKELMFGCMSGKYSVAHINKNALPDLRCAIEQQLKEINRTREILTTNDVPPPSSVAGADAGAGAAGAGAGAGAGMGAASGVGAVTTANFMPTPVVEMNSSAAEFYDRVRVHIENTLNMKQTMKNLDLNKN
ncbi:Agamous-like MADS-box protein AGL80 [Cardamine amara subsp. amara]|uniref:Agamous-like MADS-box protein AGL80 n=1 Tax=Cardamine amara subsp. amara TaxID=228776 RepID=A0ABD1B1A5_CARAN